MAEFEQEQPVVEEAPKKGIRLPILIGIILGIIIVQAGIVLAALKIFAPSADTASPPSEHTAEAIQDSSHHEEEETGPILVQKVEGIVTPKSDLYINPRGSANHIVVVSVGIEVSPAEKAKEVEEKLMIPIQDRIIARVSSYTLEQLQDLQLRDSLRTIIRNDLKPYFNALEGVKIRNVYFPKFVIQ
ncbi:MAG: flagellar basal body-associated FliL family protein [Bacteroidota bacterium]|nr:flagellar basal body-associated FliL family protein [Candidatus Kapabacteria bacterium]MCS7301975.1 flagellar basal body-associated FliL family protein [Candidatus Kapabacteria bacterium]MCX7936569.1 flagellar basal body-associated FliL family protein [Chlorobiota bacterium]MDW8074762.1 flagellar basal body-associated FliL family protein [Bacteroidota bacterium]MDW8271401.1 flagellar basal body-associated FliL family protein [Bacteroidota bacterium]